MDLNDYYKDCELKYKSDKDDWKKRADECIKKTIDYVISEIKLEISMQAGRKQKEKISGKPICIQYCPKDPYSNYYPRFNGSQSHSENYSSWLNVTVNNEEEVQYCCDKLKSKLESVGLKTSVNRSGYLFLINGRFRRHTILYHFIPK